MNRVQSEDRARLGDRVVITNPEPNRYYYTQLVDMCWERTGKVVGEIWSTDLVWVKLDGVVSSKVKEFPAFDKQTGWILLRPDEYIIKEEAANAK